MASRSWNRVELIGNLTRDPELRYTPNGAAVVTFGMATNRTYVTEGERREEADFHKLIAWNKLAELCNQLLKKGMKVFISGRLQTKSWEAQDGTKRQSTEIVIGDMIILTPKSYGEKAEAPEGEEAGYSKIETEEQKKKATVKDETEDEVELTTKETKETKEKKSVSEEKAPQEEVEDDLPF